MRRAGRTFAACADSVEARLLVESESALVLVVDGEMPDCRALSEWFRTAHPWGGVYVMSAEGATHDGQGEILRKPFDAADVADLLAAAVELAGRKRLERALEHGERLAAIGKIAAAMAHEISNPLMVIRAANMRVAQLAVSTGDADLADIVADAELAVDRIAGFVQNVRGFSRRERPVLTGLPLLDSVRMALRLVGPRAKENDVTVELEPGDDFIVRHDPPRLGQAIMNLVSNAIDSAAQGGKTVQVRVIADGSLARIEIDDDGPGIAAEIAGHLFEAFATTKVAGQGTGLGLSITRQVVEDHGGQVLLEPLAGRGARAVVTLPIRVRSVP
jgi:signal transduction histidine kinase